MTQLVKRTRFIQLAVFVGAALMLTACRVQYAPDYDEAIVNKLDTTSEETMVFLESISNGTTKESFGIREKEYNELIGVYNTLSLKAKSRPVPNNNFVKKVNELLKLKGVSEISGDYPSSVAFEKIAETLKKMKEQDREKGLNAFVVEVFKGQILAFLDQGLTYENFLKR